MSAFLAGDREKPWCGRSRLEIRQARQSSRLRVQQRHRDCVLASKDSSRGLRPPCFGLHRRCPNVFRASGDRSLSVVLLRPRVSRAFGPFTDQLEHALIDLAGLVLGASTP